MGISKNRKDIKYLESFDIIRVEVLFKIIWTYQKSIA